MDQYLDETIIDDNFRVLPDVLKSLKKERDHLKAQVRKKYMYVCILMNITLPCVMYVVDRHRGDHNSGGVA